MLDYLAVTFGYAKYQYSALFMNINNFTIEFIEIDKKTANQTIVLFSF